MCCGLITVPTAMSLPVDITTGLKSLSFEYFLNESEENYENLRFRLQNLTDSACHRAAYIVSCMNKVR